MPAYLLALDQGTTSSRSIVFDAQGRIVARAQREFPQHFPLPGWVEHDPEAIWASQLATAREALARAGLTARDLAAVGITNQRETTLLWDRRTGRAQMAEVGPLRAALAELAHQRFHRALVSSRAEQPHHGINVRHAEESVPLGSLPLRQWRLVEPLAKVVHRSPIAQAAERLRRSQ